ELVKREHGIKTPLKVTFLMEDGQLGIRDWGNAGIASCQGGTPRVSMKYSNEMLAHVLRPAIEMIGGVNEPDLHVPITREGVSHLCEYPYFAYGLVDAGRLGFKIPTWQVPQWAKEEVSHFLKGERPVVITLRESTVSPERNSREVEWTKFAVQIRKD